MGESNTLHQSTFKRILNLLFCVTGIYVCFLTWALLQERLSTTKYVSKFTEAGADATCKFTFFVFLNACQSLVCSMWAWFWMKIVRKEELNSPVDDKNLMSSILLVSISASVASPFGYMSLAHINYPTHMLAKSCKLIPVMFVGVVLHSRKYPMYKYLSVLLVTVGVSSFMFLQPHKDQGTSNSLYGIFLVLINMLLDGFTGSTQDEMFRAKKLTGSQMMLWMNVCGFLLMLIWISNPWNPELLHAVSFCKAAFPEAVVDIALFCICGALGQTFVFHALSTFGSITLVTITVTRKLFTIVLSCVFYGHSILPLQWLSIAVVFAGILFEALISAINKSTKHELKRD